MQVIRIAIWVLLTAVLTAFVAVNWTPIRVNIWPDNSDVLGYTHFQWPVGFLVIISFAAGLLPTWLLSKAGHWRLRRRIGTLENSLRAATMAPGSPPDAESFPDTPHTFGHLHHHIHQAPATADGLNRPHAES